MIGPVSIIQLCQNGSRSGIVLMYWKVYSSILFKRKIVLHKPAMIILLNTGTDLLGGGGEVHPLALARGGTIFHDKAKKY
jgi:hypothetical protein